MVSWHVELIEVLVKRNIGLPVRSIRDWFKSTTTNCLFRAFLLEVASKWWTRFRLLVGSKLKPRTTKIGIHSYSA